MRRGRVKADLSSAFNSPLVKVWYGLSTGQQVEDLGDGPPADRAERHVVAREHDAIRLRPVIAARLVVRSLERADSARVWTLVEQRRVALFLVPEERVHLCFRSVRRANLAARLLNLPGVALEIFFGPRCRDGRARRDEVLPLQRRGVGERRHIRLPRLDAIGGGQVRDVRRVVLVSEARDVVTELVHEDVRRPDEYY